MGFMAHQRYMRGRLLREGVDIDELDARSQLDVIEAVLIDMAAEGVLRVLTPSEKGDYLGWWALIVRPPAISVEGGVVELRIPSREWGVEIDDEPEPAPLRDSPGAAI